MNLTEKDKIEIGYSIATFEITMNEAIEKYGIDWATARECVHSYKHSLDNKSVMTTSKSDSTKVSNDYLVFNILAFVLPLIGFMFLDLKIFTAVMDTGKTTLANGAVIDLYNDGIRAFVLILTICSIVQIVLSSIWAVKSSNNPHSGITICALLFITVGNLIVVFSNESLEAFRSSWSFWIGIILLIITIIIHAFVAFTRYSEAA